jgi:uncharacterized protein YrzB (UPF0473 family)
MKKSSKRFTISTETGNKHGFRVDTAGIDLTEFATNPIMLWMHRRPKGESKTEILPLGYWEDIEIRDGKLTAVPVFDDEDDFALSIYKKVENGTIRMASAGLQPGNWEERSGEVWLARSKAVEFSIVDIGSNPDAVAVHLYDDQNQLIELSAEMIQSIATPKIDANMKMINLSADFVLPVIGLAEGAKPEEVQSKISEIVQLAASQKEQLATLAAEKVQATEKVTKLQAKLEEQINLAKQEKVTALVDGAVTARKITADQKEHFVKLAAADFDAAKSVLDSMPAAPTAKSVVEKSAEDANAELIKLTWDELDKSGKLIQLKASDPESFKAKFKAKFGTEYKG